MNNNQNEDIVNDEEIINENEKIEEEVANRDDLQAEDEANQIEELNEQIKQLEDKNIRLLAEFANYKKRTAQEFEQNITKGKIEVISKILEAMDNFERALEEKCSDSKYQEGIDLIYQKLVQDIKNLGVEEVDNSGKLDHRYHQALMTESKKDLENDQIVNVMQKGYILDDVLIRPSLVSVNQVSDETEKGE